MKEFYLSLKLQSLEYSAIDLEMLIFRAIMLENPQLPYEDKEEVLKSITVKPLEHYSPENASSADYEQKYKHLVSYLKGIAAVVDIVSDSDSQIPASEVMIEIMKEVSKIETE